MTNDPSLHFAEPKGPMVEARDPTMRGSVKVARLVHRWRPI
jgi:hypothetical protein